MKKSKGAIRELLLTIPLVLPMAKATAQEVSSETGQLDEVVVTAQKRSETLREVPSAISVVSGNMLEEQNVKSVNEISRYVAGLAISNTGKQGQLIVIHGIASGLRNLLQPALTATYIDDLPVGSSSAGARGGAYSSELMPYDVERIEVLKGPQGTLYGANAMGGLIKYSLRKPDLENFEARLGSGVAFLDGSSGTEVGYRGAVSFPIVAGKLALRMSAFKQDTPGWIDNIGTQAGALYPVGVPGTGTKDSNSRESQGAHLALLWKPTDSLEIQTTALGQSIRNDDASQLQLQETFKDPPTTPVFGWDTKSTAFLNPEYVQMRNFAVHVDWDLGFAQLASSTSYAHTYRYEHTDFTGNPVYFAPQYPRSYYVYNAWDTVKKYTTEARLSAPSDRRFAWMLGVFYTHEDKNERNDNHGWSDQARTLLPPPFDVIQIGTQPNPPKFTERALFTNATYKFTSRFDVSAGLRYAENRSYGCTDGLIGARGTPGLCYVAPFADYAGKWTWMGNARFHLNPDSMLYARVATGYRPGGVNAGYIVQQLPPTFGPDSVMNFEAGLKGEYLDRRLQVSAAAFDIYWKDIQLTAISPTGAGYNTNGQKARSTGAEVTADYLLGQGLKLGMVFAYTDARLTEDAPALGGRAGDPLPVTGKLSGSLFADYTWRFNDNVALVAGGMYSHRDKSFSLFKSGPRPLPLPAQNLVEIHTSLDVKSTTVRLSVQNLFNDRSYLGAELGNVAGRPMYAPVQPRTIGLNLDFSF